VKERSPIESPPGRSAWSRRWPGSARRRTRSTPPTRKGSSTATSSPRTSCWTTRARFTSRTSGSHGSSTTRPSARRSPGRFWEPPDTSRRSRRKESGPTRRATSTRSGWWPTLLVGSRPFERRTPTAEATAHVDEQVPRASARAALPPAVDEVFARARALVADLADALGDGREAVSTVAVAPRRRRRTLLAPLVAGLLLAAGGALTAVLLTSEDQGAQAGTRRPLPLSPHRRLLQRPPSRRRRRLRRT
jgi:hypothetical protein